MWKMSTISPSTSGCQSMVAFWCSGTSTIWIWINVPHSCSLRIPRCLISLFHMCHTCFRIGNTRHVKVRKSSRIRTSHLFEHPSLSSYPFLFRCWTRDQWDPHRICFDGSHHGRHICRHFPHWFVSQPCGLYYYICFMDHTSVERHSRQAKGQVAKHQAPYQDRFKWVWGMEIFTSVLHWMVLSAGAQGKLRISTSPRTLLHSIQVQGLTRTRCHTVHVAWMWGQKSCRGAMVTLWLRMQQGQQPVHCSPCRIWNRSDLKMHNCCMQSSFAISHSLLPGGVI